MRRVQVEASLSPLWVKSRHFAVQSACPLYPPIADIVSGAKENWPAEGSGRSTGHAPAPEGEPTQAANALFVFFRARPDLVVFRLGVHDLIRVILHGAGDPLDAGKLIGALSFPKIISGCIGDVELRQHHRTDGLLDARAHLFVMPGAYALDCNTPHRRKEFVAGAFRQR